MGRPDPNIEFRRVANLVQYFQRYGETLPTAILPGDVNNLQEWRPGDIIVFGQGSRYEHIAIVKESESVGMSSWLSLPGSYFFADIHP